MFLLSLSTFFYGLLCTFTILLVLIQRGKSSMGLGNMGGANQAIFGSTGGQDFFQKITWGCLILILTGSLFLAIWKGKYRFTIPSTMTHQSQSQSNSSQEK
ncbi:preprotein translocase subunit SecG [Candidatus Dependentiae bacterium]|nr:preprotein translocase subunit SecG [Candidatus Dependentiae bacterium]